MNADSSRQTRRKIQMQVEAQTINENPSQPLIRNSQSNSHSPYIFSQPQRTHIQTYHQLPSTIREQRQEVFYLPL
jgi:nitrogenase subunit NifH